MAFSNDMTKLINKIEKRLGTKLINLPKELDKTTWADEVIVPDTLTSFSRYFPNQVVYPVNRATPLKDGYYLIDEDFIEGEEVLGVKDLDWHSFTNDNLAYISEMGYGSADYVSLQCGYTAEDIAMVQMRRDFGSLFNSGIFVDFLPPNKFKLTCATNANMNRIFNNMNVLVLIKHKSLLTISPTIMETFESLAIADVAGYLFRNLKYFDGLDTAYASIDLKLQELEEQMTRREAILDTLKEASVSASNNACPIVMTI